MENGLVNITALVLLHDRPSVFGSTFSDGMAALLRAKRCTRKVRP